MYKNIQIRNALECVPRSQYFSVSREGKSPPQWKKKERERKQKKEKKLDKKIKTTVKENVLKSTLIFFSFLTSILQLSLKDWWHIL